MGCKINLMNCVTSVKKIEEHRKYQYQSITRSKDKNCFTKALFQIYYVYLCVNGVQRRKGQGQESGDPLFAAPLFLTSSVILNEPLNTPGHPFLHL